MTIFEHFILKLTGNEIEGSKSTPSKCGMREQSSPLKESVESLIENSVTSTKDGTMEPKKIKQPRWLSKLSEEYVESVRAQNEN